MQEMKENCVGFGITHLRSIREACPINLTQKAEILTPKMGKMVKDAAGSGRRR